jgi:hypothetical protein
MDTSIQPDRITKPIQLLGAWLAGLLAIDSCFLIAAAKLPTGCWEAQALTVAAIANVPLFLLAVFLLQTKFRPELQEDLYYSSYISQKTNARIPVTKEDAVSLLIQQRIERLELHAKNIASRADTTNEDARISNLKIGINTHLDDLDNIAKRLAKAGVVGYSLFGPEEPPERRVVAISQELAPETQRAILRLAAEVGFKQYSYIQDFEEIPEHVLFGSYGKETLEIAASAEA